MRREDTSPDSSTAFVDVGQNVQCMAYTIEGAERGRVGAVALGPLHPWHGKRVSDLPATAHDAAFPLRIEHCMRSPGTGNWLLCLGGSPTDKGAEDAHKRLALLAVRTETNGPDLPAVTWRILDDRACWGTKEVGRHKLVFLALRSVHPWHTETQETCPEMAAPSLAYVGAQPIQGNWWVISFEGPLDSPGLEEAIQELLGKVRMATPPGVNVR